MNEDSKSNEEVAAASGLGEKQFVNLIRFVSVLIDQTKAANLSPDEMRYVASVYRNTIELNIADQKH